MRYLYRGSFTERITTLKAHKKQHNGEKELIHYQKQNCLQVLPLVKNDITYSVLYKILQNDCTDIYTNYESIIICYSYSPYPIWVWCKDINNKSDIITISHCLKNNYLLKGNYNIILSKELLDELKKIDDIYNHLSLKMELLSYEITSINKINYLCDGYMRQAKDEDVDRLTVINRDSHFEMEGLEFSLEECRNKILRHLKNAELYVWINKDNEIVATISRSIEGKYAKIASVYTVPKHRRKGYAINLVYGVTKILLDDNLTPILYTNGGYIASNECYKKIGYKEVGRLCNVEN